MLELVLLVLLYSQTLAGDPVIIPFSTTVPPRDACTAASYLHSSGVQAIVQYGIRAFAFVRKESAEPLALEGELSYPDQNSVSVGAWGPRHASVGESHAVLVGDPTAFSLFEKFGGLLHPLAVEDGFTPFLSTAPLCATLNIPSQAYNISHSVAASVVVHNRTNRDVRAIVVSLHRVVRLRARSACVGEGELFLTASTDSDWIEHVHEDMGTYASLYPLLLSVASVLPLVRSFLNMVMQNARCRIAAPCEPFHSSTTSSISLSRY